MIMDGQNPTCFHNPQHKYTQTGEAHDGRNVVLENKLHLLPQAYVEVAGWHA